MAPEAFAVSRDLGIKHPHAAGTETLSLKLAALNQPPDVALAGPENVSDVAHSVRAVVLALPLPAQLLCGGDFVQAVHVFLLSVHSVMLSRQRCTPAFYKNREFILCRRESATNNVVLFFVGRKWIVDWRDPTSHLVISSFHRLQRQFLALAARPFIGVAY
jgi:hypothetical protein